MGCSGGLCCFACWCTCGVRPLLGLVLPPAHGLAQAAGPGFPQPWAPQICRKQYQAATEMEEHLSSYDHHHRKRLAETRVMLSERGKKDRGKRERRQQEKELQRMAAQ